VSKLTNIEEIGQQISSSDMLVFGYVHSGYEPLFESLSRWVSNVDTLILCILRYREEDIFHLDKAAERFNGRLFVIQTAPQFTGVLKRARVGVLPLAFSQIPGYLTQTAKSRKVWLFCETTPPDEGGFCNTGYSAPFPLSAYESCESVALVNKGMPATYGDTAIPARVFKYFTELPDELPLYSEPVITEITRKVGVNVAELIEDDSTIEVGVGSVISSVLNALSGKKGMRIQGGILPDEAKNLVERGVVDKCTTNVTGSYSSGFYDWLRMNPAVEVKSMEYTHNISLMSQWPKFTSVGSAVCVDLLGQVACETIGSIQITGVGGALDFARASHLSGGRSIIAMTSTYGSNKASKIVPTLDKGNVVSMTRYDVDYIVTEYGTAELKYKTRAEKALNLISVAHPSHRESLRENAIKLDLI